MDVFFHVNLPQCPVWAQPPLIDCVEKEKGGSDSVVWSLLYRKWELAERPRWKNFQHLLADSGELVGSSVQRREQCCESEHEAVRAIKLNDTGP